MLVTGVLPDVDEHFWELIGPNEIFSSFFHDRANRGLENCTLERDRSVSSEAFTQGASCIAICEEITNIMHRKIHVYIIGISMQRFTYRDLEFIFLLCTKMARITKIGSTIMTQLTQIETHLGGLEVMHLFCFLYG